MLSCGKIPPPTITTLKITVFLLSPGCPGPHYQACLLERRKYLLSRLPWVPVYQLDLDFNLFFNNVAESGKKFDITECPIYLYFNLLSSNLTMDNTDFPYYNQ